MFELHDNLIDDQEMFRVIQPNCRHFFVAKLIIVLEEIHLKIIRHILIRSDELFISFISTLQITIMLDKLELLT